MKREALDPEMRLQNSHEPLEHMQGTGPDCSVDNGRKFCVKMQAAWEVEMKQVDLFPRQLETVF